VAASTRTSASPDFPVSQETLDRYADLMVAFGANVQPGQILELRTDIGKETLTRAIAASAYRRGARFVDAFYFDPALRRARALHAAEETLDFVPSWHSNRVRQLGEQRCARIGIANTPSPTLLDGVDLARAARDRFPFIQEYFEIINDNTTNWCGAACPTPEWAEVVYPDLEPGAAYARLWEDVLHMARVDEPDPVAAWSRRLDQLERSKAILQELALDVIRFHGGGTDLSIGLLPSSRWEGGLSETVDGIQFLANLPTEEVFTAPDPQRAEGLVRATRPLTLRSGAMVRDLVVRFESGRAVSVEGSGDVEALRVAMERDEGATRLGEVALVDRESRVGARDTVFSFTLLDENAASHIALGNAYLETVGEADRERANKSSIHTDFMIGGPEVDVSAVTREGREVPLLREGAWQI
jgi:aminopeptidase